MYLIERNMHVVKYQSHIMNGFNSLGAGGRFIHQMMTKYANSLDLDQGPQLWGLIWDPNWLLLVQHFCSYWFQNTSVLHW